MTATGKNRVSFSVLCHALKRSEGTVRRLIREGMPVVRRGERGKPWVFDLPAVKAWIETREGAKGDDKDLKAKKTAAELRYRLARARREEILLAREKGELIPISSIHEAWGRRVTELKTGLTAWCNKLPPLVHEKGLPEIKETIELEVWHILDRFAREGTWGEISAPPIRNTGRSRK